MLKSTSTKDILVLSGASLDHRLHEDVAEVRVLARQVLKVAACIDEGALSFVTAICSSYMDSPYKRERARENDRRPSSKPAIPRDAGEADPGAELHVRPLGEELPAHAVAPLAGHLRVPAARGPCQCYDPHRSLCFTMRGAG